MCSPLDIRNGKPYIQNLSFISPTKLYQFTEIAFHLLQRKNYYTKLSLGLHGRKREILLPYQGPDYGVFKISNFTTINFESFGIFKSETLKNHPFDETFINSGEDVDMMIRFQREGLNQKVIDFQISDIGGASLGKGLWREARDFLGIMLLNYKHSDLLNSF